MTVPSTPPPDGSPGRISPDKGVEPVQKPLTQQTPTGFESYMKGTAAPQPQAAGAPTPMDVAKGPAFSGTPTFESIQAQTKTAQDTLGQVAQKLNDKNLKLKRSQALLVRQKLTDAQSHIRTVGSKIGIDAPPFKMPAGASGITKFLGWVNDGQDQLLAVQQKMSQMGADGKPISAADMLQMQVKMGLAQQEIEYTSALLTKVISTITQTINIQL